MPAKIPPAKRRQIASMRANGARIKEAAQAVGVHRTTAARYARKIDAAHEIAGLAAATLTAAEVADLKAVSKWLCIMACATCPETIWFLESAVVVRCPSCLRTMELNVAPTMSPKAAEVPAPPRGRGASVTASFRSFGR